jgi:hypothetical protein
VYIPVLVLGGVVLFSRRLLIVLLDTWRQNILVFCEEWVRRLLDFPTIGVVERKYLMFPTSKFHCQLHQYVYLEIRPIRGM